MAGSNWNRSARRSGGYKKARLTLKEMRRETPFGIAQGLFCRKCGAEKIAVVPRKNLFCLACGAEHDGEKVNV